MPHCIGVSLFQRLVMRKNCSGCDVAVALRSVYRDEMSFGCSRYMQSVSLKFDATVPDCQKMTS